MTKAQVLVFLNQIAEILKTLMTQLEPKDSLLYIKALAYLGVDASPDDLADDEVGCAESVSTIISKVDPSFPVITGTWTFWDKMNRSNKFIKVSDYQPGDIIISPTGTSKHGAKAPFVGHTGIIGARGTIMANDSYTGKWLSHYTIDTWKLRWQDKGGYPVYIYRIV